MIGRIVCFLDPVLASWAWANERTEMLVLQGSGGPLETDYGPAAFTNVASPEVRQYLIDLSVEAAQLGFDEILYDYVRRPEGDPAAMYFPGLESAPDVAVARFVADTNTQLADTDALLGVSVFGIAATRPEQIAQDIRLIAPHVDYVSPMVYPSHWGPGEYDVADPNRQPADIVGASIADFHAVVAGSGAAVVPWLQDFSAGGVVYGPVEVRAQIDAALAAGASGFLLWNAGSFYTAAALQPPVYAPTARLRATAPSRHTIRRCDVWRLLAGAGLLATLGPLPHHAHGHWSGSNRTRSGTSRTRPITGSTPARWVGRGSTPSNPAATRRAWSSSATG